MSLAHTTFVIADYRYLVFNGTSSDSQPSPRLHLVHHRRVLYTPRRQPSSHQTPTSTETQTQMQPFWDSAFRPVSDHTADAEERKHCAESPTDILKAQCRRPRQNRYEPYPCAAAGIQTAAAGIAAARQPNKHTNTPAASSCSSVLQNQEMDVEAEVARNYERRAQRMRASVRLYPDDDDDAGTQGKKEIYGGGNSDNEDHPYDPADAAATANYFRCIQWLRNVPLSAPPDA